MGGYQKLKLDGPRFTYLAIWIEMDELAFHVGCQLQNSIKTSHITFVAS